MSTRFLMLVALWLLGLASAASAQEILALQSIIRPQPGEAKWANVPWRTNLAEARQEAARTDKPLFVWRAGGGEVLGRA